MFHWKGRVSHTPWRQPKRRFILKVSLVMIRVMLQVFLNYSGFNTRTGWRSGENISQKMVGSPSPHCTSFLPCQTTLYAQFTQESCWWQTLKNGRAGPIFLLGFHLELLCCMPVSTSQNGLFSWWQNKTCE